MCNCRDEQRWSFCGRCPVGAVPDDAWFYSLALLTALCALYVLQLCGRLTAEIQQYRSNQQQTPGSAHRTQANAPVGAAAGSPNQDPGLAALQEQVDSLQQQLQDVQQQLETTHTDANNTIGMLREQLADARSATAAARGEAAQVGLTKISSS